MATVLTDKLTPLEPEQAVMLLADAYKRVVGRRPSVAVLKLLVAQSALESGNWKIVHNYNMGNEKADASDPYKQRYSSHDDPTDPGAYYVAFLRPEDGAEHYVRTLLGREHWRAGLMSGKPETFIRALSTPPVYFTADPARYMGTLVNRIDAYTPLAKKYGSSILGILGGFALVTAAVVFIAKKV